MWHTKNNGSVIFGVDFKLEHGQRTERRNQEWLRLRRSQTPNTGPEIFVNPCSSNLAGNGWTRFSFQITGGNWDPAKSDITLRGIDGVTGKATECLTGTSSGWTRGHLHHGYSRACQHDAAGHWSRRHGWCRILPPEKEEPARGLISTSRLSTSPAPGGNARGLFWG